MPDPNGKLHIITKENGLYYYQVGEKKQEIDIGNEKRLESVLLQFGSMYSNQKDALTMQDSEKLQKFIKESKIASKNNEAKFYVIGIPGHSFVMLFEGGEAYCFDSVGLNDHSLKEWLDVIAENKVKYKILPHEPNLKFQLKGGLLINIPIKTNTLQYCCRHEANVNFRKLEELSNKLKEKKLSNEPKEKESLVGKFIESLTEVSDEEPRLLMRINSRHSYPHRELLVNKDEVTNQSGELMGLTR
jgi:hypothetical protein